MADEANPTPEPEVSSSDPPADGGQPTGPIDVTAIVKTVTEQVTAAIGGRLAELEANTKTLADTLAKAPPADPAAISRLVKDSLAEVASAQAESAQAAEARAAKIAEITRSRLGGHSELAALITASDDAGIEQQAAQIEAVVRKIAPDFGATSSGAPAKPINDRSFKSLLK